MSLISLRRLELIIFSSGPDFRFITTRNRSGILNFPTTETSKKVGLQGSIDEDVQAWRNFRY